MPNATCRASLTGIVEPRSVKPTTVRSHRPLAVYVSLIVLVTLIGAFLTRHAIRADWANPLICVQFVIELGILGVPLLFVFLAKGWARWLLVVDAVGGWCVSAPMVRYHLWLHAGSWLFMYALISLCVVAALVGLFLPTSAQWFRGGSNATA